MIREALLDMQMQWQSNPRLQWMIYAILTTTLFYASLLLSDLHKQQLGKVGQLQQRLSKVINLKNEPEWEQRAVSMKSLGIEARSHLRKASTPGLAQAEIQSHLQRALDSQKLKRSSIRLDTLENVDGAIPLWRIGAQLQGSFKGEQLQKLIWQLNLDHHYFNIRSLNFNSSKNPRYSLFIDFWFDAEQGDGTDTGKKTL